MRELIVITIAEAVIFMASLMILSFVLWSADVPGWQPYHRAIVLVLFIILNVLAYIVGFNYFNGKK